MLGALWWGEKSFQHADSVLKKHLLYYQCLNGCAALYFSGNYVMLFSPCLMNTETSKKK